MIVLGAIFIVIALFAGASYVLGIVGLVLGLLGLVLAIMSNLNGEMKWVCCDEIHCCV